MGGLVMADITAAPGLDEPGGYLALPRRAALMGGHFSAVYSYFFRHFQINFFSLFYWLSLLLTVCGDI